MLQKGVCLLDVADDIEVRELEKEKSILSTINGTRNPDLLKRWFFYTKNLKTYFGEWSEICSILGPGGMSFETKFSNAIGKADVLISFSGAPYFAPGNLSFSRTSNNDIAIRNIEDKVGLRNVLLKYEAHEKKHHANSSGKVSPMDLKTEQAQAVLDCSVVLTEKARVGCYRRQFYQFFPTTGDTYHGWKMPEEDVEKMGDVLRRRVLALDVHEKPN